MASVNTNYGAMVALQNLNRTNTDLEAVQNRINSGLKVASAKDNGATYAIAQSMRGKVAGYGVAQNTVEDSFAVDPVQFELTSDWKLYSLDLSGKVYTDGVISAFSWRVESTSPTPVKFYVDDIVWQ